jgi:hypothetical protein
MELAKRRVTSHCETGNSVEFVVAGLCVVEVKKDGGPPDLEVIRAVQIAVLQILAAIELAKPWQAIYELKQLPN